MLEDHLTEIERLSELEKFNVLDRESHESFDRLCQAVRKVLGTSFTSLTLAGHESGWNIGSSGEATGGVLETAVARLVVQVRQPVIVSDIEVDPRFAGINFVGCGLRSVAAVPVMVGGALCMGALIAADASPRTYTARELELLNELALIGLDQLLLNRLRRNYARKAEVSRRQAEKLREQQAELKRLHKLFENASTLARIGGWELDTASQKVTWSREVYSIYELPPDIPVTIDMAFGVYAADVQEKLRASIANGESLEVEVPLVTSTGTVKWVRIISEAEMEGGRPVRFSGTIQDISEQKERQRQLERLAKHDVLTGLANRQLFQEELESAIGGADKTGGQVALMLIDLDNFKQVNDTFGHDCGDRLLKEFAGRLKRCFRGSDTIARIGGDEFAVVLPGIMDYRRLNELAERIHREMATEFDIGSSTVEVGASIGVAVYPDTATDSTELLKQADIALYNSKTSGRARHSFFENAMGELIKQRHDALSAMRGAVAEREVVPFYQPIVRASDFTLAAFEALVRWVRPNGQVVPPAFFMAALADPAMSCMIGEIMIAGVASQLVQWRQDGLDIMPVSVNVSPDQVARPDFAPALLNVCAVHGIAPGGLNVEITEHVLLSRDRQRTMRAFETLASAGIKIALDDFGTGYASLTHLKEYPVDRIKLDRSFISQLPGDTESLGIVKAVISLAHDLGKEVVAEGVETLEQAQLLAHLGCDFLQGFLFAKPLPPEAAGEFIRSHSGARAATPHKAEIVPLHAARR